MPRRIDRIGIAVTLALAAGVFSTNMSQANADGACGIVADAYTKQAATSRHAYLTQSRGAFVVDEEIVIGAERYFKRDGKWMKSTRSMDPTLTTSWVRKVDTECIEVPSERAGPTREYVLQGSGIHGVPMRVQVTISRESGLPTTEILTLGPAGEDSIEFKWIYGAVDAPRLPNEGAAASPDEKPVILIRFLRPNRQIWVIGATASDVEIESKGETSNFSTSGRTTTLEIVGTASMRVGNTIITATESEAYIDGHPIGPGLNAIVGPDGQVTYGAFIRSFD